MIARHRGEERVHSRWRPAAATRAVPARWDPEPEEALDPDPIEPDPSHPATAGSRRSRTLIGVAILVVIAAIASHQHQSSASAPILPSTPHQWAQQWTAASLDNPAQVCRQLFAPALATAIKADTGRFCAANYTSATSRSFRINHVLQDGSTSVVEAQELAHGHRSGYLTIVLSHVRDGWQAIAIVLKGSARPR